VGQVIAFDMIWRHTTRDLRSALNVRLPADVAIQVVWTAGKEFHPRFDALSRTYRYRIYAAEVCDPLRRRMMWQVERPLNVKRMNEAASALIGSHDFTSFGLPPRGDNAVREVSQASWKKTAPREYAFTITANAFLYRMVRTLVATLSQVGSRTMTVEAFRAILAARQRGTAAVPAPACGLTLIEVTYEP